MRKIGFAPLFLTLTAVSLLWLTGGCATRPQIDWNQRIGSYTYDEAVLEMGPPDKTAEISTGTVADWVIDRNRSPRISFGTGFYGSGTGVGVGTSTGGREVDKVLRLTFDQEEILTGHEVVRQ